MKDSWRHTFSHYRRTIVERETSMEGDGKCIVIIFVFFLKLKCARVHYYTLPASALSSSCTRNHVLLPKIAFSFFLIGVVSGGITGTDKIWFRWDGISISEGSPLGHVRVRTVVCGGNQSVCRESSLDRGRSTDLTRSSLPASLSLSLSLLICVTTSGVFERSCWLHCSLGGFCISIFHGCVCVWVWRGWQGNSMDGWMDRRMDGWD